MKNKIILYPFVIALVLFDQLSKFFVSSKMVVNESIPIFDGVFHITYVQNYGAAFSILQGQQTFLITITLISLAGIAVYFALKLEENHIITSLAFALILGGGLGNLVDRIRLGYVVDFFDFRVFPVFNVADICVCLGCGLLILYLLLEAKMFKESSDEDNEKDFL